VPSKIIFRKSASRKIVGEFLGSLPNGLMPLKFKPILDLVGSQNF
jgi:hypothetical protein